MSKVYLGKDENGDSIWVEKSKVRTQTPKHESYSLGCIAKQVNDFREDAKRNGYAVEFKEDKEVPGFFNCDISGLSAKQRDRYADHRATPEPGMPKADGHGSARGAMLTADDLAAAEKWARERFGE